MNKKELNIMFLDILNEFNTFPVTNWHDSEKLDLSKKEDVEKALKAVDNVFDNFCVDLDYEVIGSFDGSIDIVFSNIRGCWDIKHAFESESMNGMSCSYSFTYGVASTTVTYQAEELPLLSCVTGSNNRFNYVEKTIKWNIYEYFDASLAIGLGPFGISTPISGNLYKVLDSCLDITVIYKEAKE